MEAQAQQQASAQEEAQQVEAFTLDRLQVRHGPGHLCAACTPLPGPASPARRWQEFGVAAADIKKLREGGVHTVETLAYAAKKDLVAIKGLSEAKVEKIQSQGAPRRPAAPAALSAAGERLCCAAAWKVVPMGFTTATMVAEQRQDMIQICTGCKELDSILEGVCTCPGRPRQGPTPRAVG